jgi:alpha-galactosidase
MNFSAVGLPSGLELDRSTGIITGTVPETEGEYETTLKAENDFGKDERSWKLVVGEKIALTPPTGWNSWGGHMLFVSDELMRKAADLFVEKGLADVGFQYVSVDDCWMRINREVYEAQSENRRKNHAGYPYNEGVVGGERDQEGNIVPNDFFPDMKAMTDYIHSFGLKAGLYSTPGLTTCQDFAGSLGHQEQDAEQYARWGFDLLKYDLCSGNATLAERRRTDPDYTQAEYWKPMSDFIRSQDRDILFNLCQYGREEPWKWAPGIGIQTWRTGGDLNHHVDTYFEQALRLATELREYSKPGQWNDPDFMYIHKIRDYRAKGEPSYEIPLNTNQRYQYVTLWSIIAAPFFFSCDLHEIDDFTIGLLTNADVLNINQDELGYVRDDFSVRLSPDGVGLFILAP